MTQITKNKDIGRCKMDRSVIFAQEFFAEESVAHGFINFFQGLTWRGVQTGPGESLLFWDGTKTPAKEETKAQTGGRSIRAKCSPMERSTLPRRPILQKYLSRPKDAVLLWDCRDGPVRDAIKGKRRGLPCPSLHSTETRTVLQ